VLALEHGEIAIDDRAIVGPGERSPIRTRSGEDVVLIRPIADAIDRITALGQRRLFVDRGPAAMKLLNVHRDEISQGVVPGCAGRFDNRRKARIEPFDRHPQTDVASRIRGLAADRIAGTRRKRLIE